MNFERHCSVPTRLLAQAVDTLRDAGQSTIAMELLAVTPHRDFMLGTPVHVLCRLCEKPLNSDLWHRCW